jgi:isocitrate dehydrogenase
MDIPEIQLNNKNVVLIILSLIFLSLLFIIYRISSSVNEGLVSSKKRKSSSKMSISEMLATSKIQQLKDSKTTYNNDNLDITYHDSIDNIIATVNGPTLQNYDKTIINQDGESVNITLSETLGNVLYSEPGTYKYGLPSYVPSYEDSIFLSKTYNKYATYDNDHSSREVTSQTVA